MKRASRTFERASDQALGRGAIWGRRFPEKIWPALQHLMADWYRRLVGVTGCFLVSEVSAI